MPGYQHTTIIGHVGRDPEMRYTQDGTAVCSFSVAVTRKWSQGGERKEETTWFRVTAWRGLAETAGQYVHKGMQIMVAGRVSVSAYMKDDEARATLELTARDMQFLGGRGGEPGASTNPQPARSERGDLPF